MEHKSTQDLCGDNLRNHTLCSHIQNQSPVHTHSRFPPPPHTHIRDTEWGVLISESRNHFNPSACCKDESTSGGEQSSQGTAFEQYPKPVSPCSSFKRLIRFLEHMFCSVTPSTIGFHRQMGNSARSE
ncbi:glutamate receptor ionotropic, delta-2-like [Platysternon megacephalum]|uniref:Glutamate receptor ionotropic, delta-2-like n=1 Tax=Platysternon megacephalum TaxID=55544 RepID=A0A4D9E5Y2_9SAUR|nr:glutamate receptor ionotropic, delta-2-like [Platysternon megacephalum]